MFFCRKCLTVAAAAPKVLTPILVPAATPTGEEEDGEVKEDSTPKIINTSLNTPRTSPTIPPTNPITKPNKTRTITVTNSILIVWKSLSPIKVARLFMMILENSFRMKSLTMYYYRAHFIMYVTILWFQAFKAFTVCLLASLV
jgi:hypothetical protein